MEASFLWKFLQINKSTYFLVFIYAARDIKYSIHMWVTAHPLRWINAVSFLYRAVSITTAPLISVLLHSSLVKQPQWAQWCSCSGQRGGSNQLLTVLWKPREGFFWRVGKLVFGKRSWLSYDSHTSKWLRVEHLSQLCVEVTDAFVRVLSILPKLLLTLPNQDCGGA